MTDTAAPLPFSVRHPARRALAVTALLALCSGLFGGFLGHGPNLLPVVLLAVLAVSGMELMSGDRIGLAPGVLRNPQRWSVGVANAVYFGVLMYALNARPGGDPAAIRVWLGAGLAFGLAMMVMARPAHPALAAHFARLHRMGPAGGFGWVRWLHPVATLLLAVSIAAIVAQTGGGLREQGFFLALLLSVACGLPLYHAPRQDGPEAALWRIVRVVNLAAFAGLVALWYGAR